MTSTRIYDRIEQLAFEEATDDDMLESRLYWSNGDRFEMWGASVGAKYEIETAEDCEPFDPDEWGCRPW